MPSSPVYNDPTSQAMAKEVAVRNVMKMLGLGAAAGVGVRGVMGLGSMMSNQDLPVMPSNNLPHTLRIQRRPQERQSNGLPAMPKFAMALPPMLQSGMDMARTGLNNISNSVQSAAGKAGDFLGKLPEKIVKTVAPYTPDTHTRNPSLDEWSMPAGALALAGGGYGGYKALDWLLNKERQQTGARELQDAEDEYHQALAAQYQAAMMGKQAGDDLGLTALADQYINDPDSLKPADTGMQKEAFLPSILGKIFPQLDSAYANMPFVGHDRWQAFKGAVNTASTAALLGAGKVTYDWAKGQNRQELLRKALAQRQMARQRLSPPPLVAINEDEQDGT